MVGVILISSLYSNSNAVLSLLTTYPVESIIRGDPELAKEILILLGRELKNPRKTISNSKEQLQQNMSCFL
jgi:hypothetical protein